jgi:hypothetical protein
MSGMRACNTWRAAGMLGGLAMLACLLATGLAGCLFIPTAEHGLMDGRGIIEEADTAFLADDTTLREDVVLRFGEPDLVIDQGRFLVYHWSRVQGYLFLGGGYTGQLIPLERNHFLVLEFDEAGHVKEFELTGRLPASLSSRTAKGTWRDTVQRKHIVIDPAPEAPAGPDAPGIATPAIRLGMGEFRRSGADAMPANLVGHKTAAFGVVVADVLVPGPLMDVVRTAVAAQFEHAGHVVVVQGADVVVSSEAVQFGVTTPVHLSSWDAVGSLDITLTFSCASTGRALLVRRYQSTQVAKTVRGPAADEFQQVTRACLEELQGQVAADAELIALLRSELIPRD